MATTMVYEIIGEKRRLVHTIGFGSCFCNLPWTGQKGTDMGNPELQLKAGRELANMWKRNGPNPHAIYTVEQTD